MFHTLYNFLKYNFNDPDLINIRQQKVSLGLIYNIQGHEEIIDVVPVFRTDFIRGKNDYNLFKNPKFSSGSKTLKMNPYKQKDFGNNENKKKSVLWLIKILRIEEELSLKPILIKELIKKASEDVEMPKTINQQLIRILEFIRDNIVSIKIKSPDNKKITLTDSVSFSDKIEIKSALKGIILNLKHNKDPFSELLGGKQAQKLFPNEKSFEELTSPKL